MKSLNNRIKYICMFNMVLLDIIIYRQLDNILYCLFDLIFWLTKISIEINFKCKFKDSGPQRFQIERNCFPDLKIHWKWDGWALWTCVGRYIMLESRTEWCFFKQYNPNCLIYKNMIYYPHLFVVHQFYIVFYWLNPFIRSFIQL